MVKCLALLLLLGLLTPGVVQAQAEPTPTPNDEGVIFVEVQPNDSLWAIAARAGLTLEQLLELNALTEDAVVQPGDRLIIGYGTPAPTPTSDLPTPTLPPPSPQATAILPRTAICLAAFEDGNRNGVHEAGEPLRSGVAFTIYNSDSVVANYITDGVSEPHCIEGLAAGTYFVTRSIGRGEILTTQGDWALTLAQGSELNQAFGSYSGATVNATQTAALERPQEAIATLPPVAALDPAGGTEEGGSTFLNVLLIAVGVILLIGAGVLSLRFGFGRR